MPSGDLFYYKDLLET